MVFFFMRNHVPWQKLPRTHHVSASCMPGYFGRGEADTALAQLNPPRH